MTHVELIGCTGAGKSTLTLALKSAGRRRGLRVATATELVLEAAGLAWMKCHFVRERIVDMAALCGYLATWKPNHTVLMSSIRVIRSLKGTTYYKLNLARNLIRKLGLVGVVKLLGRDQDIVLVDNDGVLQAAHYLFVHVSDPPSGLLIDQFANLAPKPTVVLYLRHRIPVLTSRTLERGHKRIPAARRELTELFVSRGVKTFERLCAAPALSQRLVTVDGWDGEARTRPNAEEAESTVADLVRDAIANYGSDDTSMQGYAAPQEPEHWSVVQ